jgi:hypothetical protein
MEKVKVKVNWELNIPEMYSTQPPPFSPYSRDVPNEKIRLELVVLLS